MKLDHEVRYDGPSIHVYLPDIVPPDWEAVRRSFDRDAYVSRAFITAPTRMTSEDEAELIAISEALSAEGANVSMIRLPEFFG